MPYEDDYKMWLEKMLIEMNPDWVCDGMADKEFTHDWCGKYCGKDNAYITPKCLYMYYHHIALADRNTENSSEKPNNCDTCIWSVCNYNKVPWDTDCNGCKFINTYDTEFPCANCSRKTKDYYAKDEPQERSE